MPETPDGSAATHDPRLWTEPFRAAAYANDARKIVEQVRKYEHDHPDDAPCLEVFLRAIPDISWRRHDAV